MATSPDNKSVEVMKRLWGSYNECSHWTRLQDAALIFTVWEIWELQIYAIILYNLHKWISICTCSHLLKNMHKYVWLANWHIRHNNVRYVIMCKLNYICTYKRHANVFADCTVQWNLSKVDTIGTQLAVLCRGGFLHSSMWLGLQTVSSLKRCP